MQTANSALTSLFMKEFEWCKISKGESVAILMESESRWEYAHAAQSAAAAMGARPLQVMLPSSSPAQSEIPSIDRGNASSVVLNNYPEATGLLKSVDFIVDLSLDGLIHSQQRGEILKSGTRTLLIKEPPDALERLRSVATASTVRSSV